MKQKIHQVGGSAGIIVFGILLLVIIIGAAAAYYINSEKEEERLREEEAEREREAERQRRRERQEAEDAAAASCEDVNCGTNGTCSNGSCVCDSGWSGNTCSVSDTPTDSDSSSGLSLLFSSTGTQITPEPTPDQREGVCVETRELEPSLPAGAVFSDEDLEDIREQPGHVQFNEYTDTSVCNGGSLNVSGEDAWNACDRDKWLNTRYNLPGNKHSWIPGANKNWITIKAPINNDLTYQENVALITWFNDNCGGPEMEQDGTYVIQERGPASSPFVFNQDIMGGTTATRAPATSPLPAPTVTCTGDITDTSIFQEEDGTDNIIRTSDTTTESFQVPDTGNMTNGEVYYAMESGQLWRDINTRSISRDYMNSYIKVDHEEGDNHMIIPGSNPRWIHLCSCPTGNPFTNCACKPGTYLDTTGSTTGECGLQHMGLEQKTKEGYSCCVFKEEHNPCHDPENQTQTQFNDFQGGGNQNSLLNSLHIGDYYNFDNPMCNIKDTNKGLVYPEDENKKKEWLNKCCPSCSYKRFKQVGAPNEFVTGERERCGDDIHYKYIKQAAEDLKSNLTGDQDRRERSEKQEWDFLERYLKMDSQCFIEDTDAHVCYDGSLDDGSTCAPCLSSAEAGGGLKRNNIFNPTVEGCKDMDRVVGGQCNDLGTPEDQSKGNNEATRFSCPLVPNPSKIADGSCSAEWTPTTSPVTLPQLLQDAIDKNDPIEIPDIKGIIRKAKEMANEDNACLSISPDTNSILGGDETVTGDTVFAPHGGMGSRKIITDIEGGYTLTEITSVPGNPPPQDGKTWYEIDPSPPDAFVRDEYNGIKIAITKDSNSWTGEIISSLPHPHSNKHLILVKWTQTQGTGKEAGPVAEDLPENKVMFYGPRATRAYNLDSGDNRILELPMGNISNSGTAWIPIQNKEAYYGGRLGESYVYAEAEGCEGGSTCDRPSGHWEPLTQNNRHPNGGEIIYDVDSNDRTKSLAVLDPPYITGDDGSTPHNHKAGTGSQPESREWSLRNFAGQTDIKEECKGTFDEKSILTNKHMNDKCGTGTAPDYQYDRGNMEAAGMGPGLDAGYRQSSEIENRLSPLGGYLPGLGHGGVYHTAAAVPGCFSTWGGWRKNQGNADYKSQFLTCDIKNSYYASAAASWNRGRYQQAALYTAFKNNIRRPRPWADAGITINNAWGNANVENLNRWNFKGGETDYDRNMDRHFTHEKGFTPLEDQILVSLRRRAWSDNFRHGREEEHYLPSGFNSRSPFYLMTNTNDERENHNGLLDNDTTHFVKLTVSDEEENNSAEKIGASVDVISGDRGCNTTDGCTMIDHYKIMRNNMSQCSRTNFYHRPEDVPAEEGKQHIKSYGNSQPYAFNDYMSGDKGFTGQPRLRRRQRAAQYTIKGDSSFKNNTDIASEDGVSDLVRGTGYSDNWFKHGDYKNQYYKILSPGDKNPDNESDSNKPIGTWFRKDDYVLYDFNGRLTYDEMNNKGGKTGTPLNKNYITSYANVIDRGHPWGATHGGGGTDPRHGVIFPKSDVTNVWWDSGLGNKWPGGTGGAGGPHDYVGRELLASDQRRNPWKYRGGDGLEGNLGHFAANGRPDTGKLWKGLGGVGGSPSPAYAIDEAGPTRGEAAAHTHSHYSYWLLHNNAHPGNQAWMKHRRSSIPVQATTVSGPVNNNPTKQGTGSTPGSESIYETNNIMYKPAFGSECNGTSVMWNGRVLRMGETGLRGGDWLSKAGGNPLTNDDELGWAGTLPIRSYYNGARAAHSTAMEYGDRRGMPHRWEDWGDDGYNNKKFGNPYHIGAQACSPVSREDDFYDYHSGEKHRTEPV